MQQWQLPKWIGMLVVLLLVIHILASSTHAQTSNPIIVENQQPGSDLWQYWLSGFTVSDDISKQIKGYASATSVNKGETITFYVTVNPIQTYYIKIYRIGWYNGKGGRYMLITPKLMGVQQPECPIDSDTGLIACNWSPSYTLSIPDTWTSGIYLALIYNENNYANYINFVVRDDNRAADLLYQESVTTTQAYNNYPNDKATGKSLYPSNSFGPNTISGAKRAVKVSFDRPYNDNGAGQFLEWEAYFVRWMEKSGYDVSYSTDLDTHINGQRLLKYKGFLSVGHDEYWSKEMYDAAEAARDKGVNLAFFGANEVYWQVRLESSASGLPNRIMVCYKDAVLDPATNSAVKTVNWRDPLVNRPEQQLVGVQFTNVIDGGYSGQYAPYVVTNSKHWIYNGTGFKDGDSVPGLVGYEVDRYHADVPLPANIHASWTTLSHSPFNVTASSTDIGNASIYQAPSGAWVFAAGTIGWSWGLDNFRYHNVADPRIQQTTANILNAFITKPPSPPSNLIASVASSREIDLSWTDNSDNEIGFVLERSNDSNFTSIVNIMLPANTTSYADTSVNTSTIYYRIKATNELHDSLYSNVTSATISDVPFWITWMPLLQNGSKTP